MLTMKGVYDNVLWDIPQHKIDTLPQDFLIRRVLTYGTVTMIIRLKHMHGVDTLQRVFTTMKPTSVPQRKYAYLKNFLLT